MIGVVSTARIRRLARRIAVGAGAAVLAGAGLLVTAPDAGAAPGPASAPEYWFDSWHIDRLWHDGARGQGVVIAEIDTGVNAQLRALSGRVLRGKDFGQPGDGRIDRDKHEFGHGTAMASIMVGRPATLGITGIAPGARILPIAVPLSGTTDASPNDHLAPAIRWAADHGAKIISMALGGTSNPKTTTTPCPADEQAAIYYALRKGAVLLAAAGNQGQSGNAVEEPGVCLGVVSVGAVNRQGTVASFSSRHRYVTLTAPGVAIPSLGRIPGAAYAGNGTSQATAIATAVTALVWSKHPSLDGRQVVARLLATLDDRRARPSPAYGYGQLNGYQAVTAAVPAGAADPVYAAAAPFAARARAFAQAPPAVPPPAASHPANPGAFGIGSAPRLHLPQVVAGVVVGGCGLLGLVALVIAPPLRRRRLRAASGPSGPSGPSAPARFVDADGLEWHEILDGDDPDSPR